ncbi:MAG: LuxR family transcriptional regulator, partial [Actinocrinis sp.]
MSIEPHGGYESADLPDEARATYALVLRSGSIPVAAQLAGLQQLADLGLVELSEDGEELLAVDPRQIELRLTGDWRRKAWELELRAATLERDISALTAEYIAANGVRRDAIRYLHGGRAIADFVELSARGAKREILTAQPGGARGHDVLLPSVRVTREQRARGIALRSLYQHTARFSEPTKEYVREVTAHGGEVRTLDEFFERIVIVDRTSAILPAAIGDGEAGQQDAVDIAVALGDEAVVRFLADVFDRTWQRAVTFVPSNAAAASKEVVPEMHAMIKRLLKEGLTDSAIAKRIGVSERTYHT